MPCIEFADAVLYVEGILGLSSRESFLKAYMSGRISVHGLHSFRRWAPDILARLLKIDRRVYHTIVCSGGKSIDWKNYKRSKKITGGARVV